MTSMYGPVTDWANDFDHGDPAYNERAHEIWAEFQESGCPVAHSDRYDGLWARRCSISPTTPSISPPKVSSSTPVDR